MEVVSIDNLRKIYENLRNKESKLNQKKYFNFHYLNLSVLFGREDREFDIHNYQLLKNLNYKNKIKKNSSNIQIERNSAFEKYLKSFKEYSYLPRKKIALIFCLDIIKYAKQILDLHGITLIVFIGILFNIFCKTEKNTYRFNKDKIYSIYYWEKKKSKSSIYYYPDIKDKKDIQVFVTTFAGSKFFTNGLFNSILNSKFISPEKVLNLRDLILSIFQFFHLFLHDLYYVFIKKDFKSLSLWIGWKKSAEIFYGILVYNSILKLAKHSQKCEFISWYENQFTNRAFSLGVSFAQQNFKSSCSLSTFNGTLFTQKNKVQLLPLKKEYEIGFWGEKYYVQDEGSQKEMQSYLKKVNLNINVVVSSQSMKRTNLVQKNKYQKPKIPREITIFTHASYWDLTACILSIFNDKEDKLTSPKILKRGIEEISIRLHPALNKIEATKVISKIREIPNNLKYNFIELSEESIIDSIKASNYCVFGISTYINLALELEAKVISVNTNHTCENPIKYQFRTSPYLTITNPW